MIKLLSLFIVVGLVFESNQQGPEPESLQATDVQSECWTDWFDRDDPSGTGDWETIFHLHESYPGKICPTPTEIEVETLSGSSSAGTGDVIFKNDIYIGFICKNKDQPSGQCNDYRVRFRCPPIYCEKECWTNWFDRDDPSGTGDWETIFHLYQSYPGKICPTPMDIEVKTLSGSTPVVTGDVVFAKDVYVGFICRNKDQPSNNICHDYRIRFRCPPIYCQEVCWTKWYDRDNPSGTGDWELLNNLREENPNEICEKPLYIEAVTTDTLTPATSTGQNLFVSPLEGFVCLNHQQKTDSCHDYKVRFGCPC